MVGWLQERSDVQVVDGAYDPTAHGTYWFIGFAVVGVVASAIGIADPIRSAVGGFRATGDAALRRAGGAGAVVAIIGSTMLASVAGILLALISRTVTKGSIDSTLSLTVIAFGIALLGGTSAFGRRGGILGVVVADILLVILWRYVDAEKWNITISTIGAAAMLAGLVVTRLVESFGRATADYRPPVQDRGTVLPQAVESPAASDPGWSANGESGGWTVQLSNKTSEETGWSGDERWGAR
jgi:hypothetical protein